MWLLPVLVAAAAVMVVYLRWFLKRVESRASRLETPQTGTATLSAADVAGQTIVAVSSQPVSNPQSGYD